MHISRGILIALGVATLGGATWVGFVYWRVKNFGYGHGQMRYAGLFMGVCIIALLATWMSK